MPVYEVGPTRTYATITAAFAAIPPDITGTGVHQVIVDAGIYNEIVEFPNAIGIDTNNYVWLTCASGSEHNGDPNAGVIIRTTPSAFTAALRITKGCRVTNIVVNPTGSGSDRWGVQQRSSSAGLTPAILENVVVLQSTFGYGYLIGNVFPVWLYNCLAIGRGSNRGFWWQGTTTDPHRMINCGSYNFAEPFLTNNQAVINCWAYKAVGSTNNAFQGASALSSNNASNDTTAPGTNSVLSLTLAQFGFVDSANNNFHITTSSALYNAGADRSANFTIDIDNQTIGIWCIGPDSYPPTVPVSPTSSKPFRGYFPTGVKVAEAPGHVPDIQPTDQSDNDAYPSLPGEAKGHSPAVQYGESSQPLSERSSASEAERFEISGKKGQRTGWISVMPELNGYDATNPGLGTGWMMPFLIENLALNKEFRDLDLVGLTRARTQRRSMFQSPEGKVEFAVRSSTVIPLLQSHFQRRIGTTATAGTSYYEFVPSRGRIDLSGSAFGTGSYSDASAYSAFPLSVFKDIGGNGFHFKTGLIDKLSFKFHAVIEPTVEAAFKFREGTPSGTSSSHPYGTYATSSEYSPHTCSVDFMGMPVIDFEFTSNNQLETRFVTGDSRPIHRLGQYSLRGNATIDLGNNVQLGYGSVLSGSSFSVSATMYNADHDRIVFQMPDCRVYDFPTGFAGIYKVPFQAFASEDGSTAPIKAQVWTKNYNAFSFQPS